MTRDELIVMLTAIVNFRGSAIAKIVGANAKTQSGFADRVTMYVYEEIINGKKLTEIINQMHENVKYLPGHKIPENVVRRRFDVARCGFCTSPRAGRRKIFTTT